MDKKITAATPLADVPTCFAVENQPLYCPVNYDRKFHGLVQARFALGNSYNIPAVRVLYLNGVANFVKFANKMGLTTLTDPSRYGLSLTLGGGEVRMVDMAVAFGVFANSGIKQNLVSILKVEDWHGKILEETKIKEGDRIIPMEVAYIISHILLDNNARSAAFGESSYLNVRGHPEVSVKTGTTNDKRDNWTIGYTPEAVVAVWVGNNDNTPMSAVASGVTGASPIWNKIMRETLDRIEDGKLAGTGQIKEKHSHVWMSKPDGVIGHNVCATSGTLEATASSETSQNENCPSRFEYFQEGDYSLPPVERQPVAILRDTGMLAPPNSPPEQTEIQEHNVVKDPLGTIVCLDCPIPTWSVTVR
jgi:membrane carboxypeptidase/penicillin-binding protein PbpC